MGGPPLLPWSLAIFACALGARAQTMPQSTTTLDTRSCLPPHDALPFCNVTLPIADRVNDLIARLFSTNLSSIPYHLTARNYGQSALPALGLQEYGKFGAPPAKARP